MMRLRAANLSEARSAPLADDYGLSGTHNSGQDHRPHPWRVVGHKQIFRAVVELHKNNREAEEALMHQSIDLVLPSFC
jgi:hypothetical protein